MTRRFISVVISAATGAIAASALSAAALTITPTTSGTDLAAALGGAGLTITSVTITNGVASQFGTYTGFTSPPVTIDDGVVLSTGQVTQTTSASHSIGTSPSTNLRQPGTAKFDAYGPGHITNFDDSNDVASLQVNFSLGSASQVGFDFVFGSVEFPEFTNNFTDAFLAFLDGTSTADQIVFDPSNNAVQVGTTFVSSLTTADTNTAFFDPHGLVNLQTFTVNPLAAGNHSIIFEVGDVNDRRLDSAVFISNFHAGAGTGGTGPINPAVPEPTTVLLLGSGLAGLAWWRLRNR